MTKVVFFHGLSGNPVGTKYQALCKEFGRGNVYSEPLGFERGRGFFDGCALLRMSMVFGARLHPAVRVAQKIIREHKPDVIVASSLGAGVAMLARNNNTPMVLLAPAWNRESIAQVVGHKLPGLTRQAGQTALSDWLPKIQPEVPQHTVVLHSEADSVIPFTDSETLISYNQLGEGNLIEVGYSHELNEPEALDAMVAAVKRLGDPQMLVAGVPFHHCQAI